MEELINDKTIIKNDIYNVFKDSITCPLCLNILINPVMCLNCQNTYCKKCIDNLSQKSQNCPNRCINPNYQKCISKNDILSKFKFECKGCGNSIQYNNIRKHYNECCPDKIPAEGENKTENNIEKEETENKNAQKKSKFQKISNEEIEILKKKGNDVAYITGKKKIFLILF